jgi:hypothetical protein
MYVEGLLEHVRLGQVRKAIKFQELDPPSLLFMSYFQNSEKKPAENGGNENVSGDEITN